MRILYFHQHFTTPAGSTGNRSYAFAQALLAQGHDVTMVCGSYDQSASGLSGPFRRGKREGNVDGLRVVELMLPYSNTHGFLKRGFTFLRFALAGCVEALRRPCDLVFASSTPLTAGIPGILARFLRRKPFVFEVRDLWPELPREMGVITNPVVLRLMDWLEWVSYRSATACIGLSPGIVQGIARRGVPSDRIAMIPNGCDLDIFDPGASSASSELESRKLTCIFAGTHGIANGLDAVLKAAEVLKQRGREDIEILLVGNGKLKASLRAEAARIGLDNVVFRDPVPKPELSRLLHSSDVGLQILANVPAFYEGTSPNKFFDYLACGLPVLNNYPGWIARLVEEHQCGFVVPPDDPAAFADALERAADDRAALAEMGRRARRLADDYARERMAEDFVRFVERAGGVGSGDVRA